MNIGSLTAPPPAPEQVHSAKKSLEAKPADQEDTKAAPPPPAQEAQKIESRPSDPDGAGKFHAIA